VHPRHCVRRTHRVTATVDLELAMQRQKNWNYMLAMHERCCHLVALRYPSAIRRRDVGQGDIPGDRSPDFFLTFSLPQKAAVADVNTYSSCLAKVCAPAGALAADSN
jgi:hypothetical protein